jgi:ubiquinone/menaquinone biosynthesis C-methylase UbiE
VMDRVEGKKIEDIATEWDRIADIRAEHIYSGRDVTFDYVLKPAILKMMSGLDAKHVLDVGCGSGFLTASLSTIVDRITGIDVSSRSIELAHTYHGALMNVSFTHSSLGDLAKHSVDRFDVVIANMVLTNVIELDTFFSDLTSLIAPSGRLIMTITHPWFWSIYWGYSDQPWYNYNEELIIESPFDLSLDNFQGLGTTHVHRPLEMYIEALSRNQFVTLQIMEPMPSTAVQPKYRIPWRDPRFLAMHCRYDPSQ